MTKQEVEDRLRAHIKSNPYRGSNTYWPAEEALDAQVPGVSQELMTAYFQKVQETWPEVPPRLHNRDAPALEAWARAAEEAPHLHWNSVLLACWDHSPKRLLAYYQTLSQICQAASSPECTSLPSDDPQLVGAIRDQLGAEAPGHLPIGWSATLLAEGSRESVAAVYEHVLSEVTDPLLTFDLDDLLRLSQPVRTSHAEKLLADVRAMVEQRDAANGQTNFFNALRVSNIPAVFSYNALLLAKSGHSCQLSLSRDWRRSIVSWNVNIGKQQSRFLISDRGLMVNKLKLGRYRLDQLGQLLKDSAQAVKTRWLLPWKTEYLEGLDPNMESRLNAYCRDWV